MHDGLITSAVHNTEALHRLNSSSMYGSMTAINCNVLEKWISGAILVQLNLSDGFSRGGQSTGAGSEKTAASNSISWLSTQC